MPPLLKPWLPPALSLLLLLAAALGPAAATLRPPPTNATLPSGSGNSSGHAAAASQRSLPLPSIAIPIRPPLLPPVPAVRLGPGAAVDLVVEPVELKVRVVVCACVRVGVLACSAVCVTAYALASQRAHEPDSCGEVSSRESQQH